MKFYGSNDMTIKRLMEVPEANLTYCYNPDKIDMYEREITVDFGVIQITMTCEQWDDAISSIQTIQSDLYAKAIVKDREEWDNAKPE